MVESNIKRFSHTTEVSAAERFLAVSKRLWKGDVSVSFFPYAELKHTWSVERDRIEFRLSDYVIDAPEDVIESLAWYLACKATHTRCDDGRKARYIDYVRSREFWKRKKDQYLKRAKGLSKGPQGRVRDLGSVFEYVNGCYFSGTVARPILVWTSETPGRRLGYYFEPLNLLAINSVMDSEEVPRYVLEFVVYHELLHHIDADGHRKGKRVHHTKRFREQERRFNHFDDAEKWLRRLARRKNHPLMS